MTTTASEIKLKPLLPLQTPYQSIIHLSSNPHPEASIVDDENFKTVITPVPYSYYKQITHGFR